MEQISKKLMSWASILEDSTRQQAERTASMPFIFPHLALMPDAHLGKGATVGSVIPTLGAIIPAAVGVDIGCGMTAVRTQFAAEEVTRRGDLGGLRQAIERAIPLSAGVYNKAVYGPQTAGGSRSWSSVTARTAPRRSRRTGACSWARSARATTSSRSASTSRTGSGCSCTPGPGASATGWRSGTSRSRRL